MPMERRRFIGSSLGGLALAMSPGLFGSSVKAETPKPLVKGPSTSASYPGLKLALFSYSYRMRFGSHDVKPQTKAELPWFLQRAAALGLEGVQLDITHLKSTEPHYLATIRAQAEQLGLYIEYGSTLVEEARTRAELEVARVLGARLMRTYMGFSQFEKTTKVAEETNKAVAVLKGIAPLAQERGIRIALENHCDAKVDELLHVIEMIDSPFVGVCVDLGNFMIHLENPLESVKRLAPHIINTHFKDYDMKMMNWGFKSYGVPLGEGVIDLAGILNVLVEKSGLDRITMEIVSEPQETIEQSLAWEDESVRRSVVYAREVLGIGRKAPATI